MRQELHRTRGGLRDSTQPGEQFAFGPGMVGKPEAEVVEHRGDSWKDSKVGEPVDASRCPALPMEYNCGRKRIPSVAVVRGDALTSPIRVVLTIALATSMLSLGGCPNRTSISSINRDPGRFAGKQVTIGGRVTDAFGALGSGVFQVDDGTGTLWVYSQNFGVPANDAQVSVTGLVTQGFSFSGRTFATILRQTQARH